MWINYLNIVALAVNIEYCSMISELQYSEILSGQKANSYMARWLAKGDIILENHNLLCHFGVKYAKKKNYNV